MIIMQLVEYLENIKGKKHVTEFDNSLRYARKRIEYKSYNMHRFLKRNRSTKFTFSVYKTQSVGVAKKLN